MNIRNKNLFVNGTFQCGSFDVTDGKFADVTLTGPEDPALDYVVPGLVDVHTHGNSGADFSDGDLDGLRRMAAFYAAHGVTSFAPASMTLPYETLSAAFRSATALREENSPGLARLMGINMEGPFFCEKKKGAQNAVYLKNPDFEAFRRLQEECGGLVKIVDLAPELPGSLEFIRRAKELATVSIGHTDASYEQARDAIAAGASHLTHLFNAMPGIHHRNPGVIGAGSEDDRVIAELICDGFHVHPSAVRMAFRLFPGRICIISDSLRCAGMPDGEYELGGQTVYLRGGAARLADGTIAGSVSNLWECMSNAVKFGIDRESAILAATLTPAREIGADSLVGSIGDGKLADYVICDRAFNRKSVIIGGQAV